MSAKIMNTCFLDNMDYYPFGMQMPSRSFTGASGYKFGFNGMLKDGKDWTGNNDSHLDFGARIYDSRLGRFLSIDPLHKDFPNVSNYSYALNSPIFFIDVNGEYPKVAIIIGPAEGKKGHNDFNDHKVALEKNGYKVLYAETGQQAMEIMSNNSSPQDPIESLILLSHGSPGGLSNGEGGGIYTQMEIEIMAKNEFALLIFDANVEALGGIENISNVELDEINQKVDKVMEAFDKNKNLIIDSYKKRTGAVSTKDIAENMENGNISTNKLTIVVGGCNTAGYSPPDEQVIFTKELSEKTKSDVYGAQGKSSPVHNSTKRKAKKWVKTSPDGTQKSSNSNTIDLSNPSK